MFLCGCLALSLALLLHVASPEPCQLSNGCPNLSSHSLNLSSLRGVWETAFFTRPEGSLVDNVPSFFNISVCGSVPAQRTSQCSDSSICYSEHQDTFYSLGSSGSCDVSYANRQVQFVFEYSQGAANIFGQGNVTVTLVCGRNLGVPEVIAGDPNSHAIEILWITSAACKTDPSHSATNESKCYYIHAYEDQGIKAKLVDLTNLIRPGGYEATYAERGAARFVISVCRPMEGTNTSACNGAMACLVTQPSPGFNIHQDVPLALGFRRDESNLHMDGDLLTAVYSSEVASCENHKRLVKVHFLCPSGIQAVGPTIGFLDDSLCLIVVNWYTSYACGTGAIQSHGCQLTTSGGVAFDLSGLAPKVEISSVSGGHTYLYNLQICSGNSLNEHCNGRPPSPAVRVSQTDPADSGVCYSLGVGDGKLRYADGSLTLTYTLGDTCHSNFARTSVISFVCPESTGNASNTTELSFVGEDNCFYEFEWITPLACGATTSGASDCQFELGGSKYNFAPLVGRDDKNWVAIDDDNNTACFMINPCGDLEVTEDKLSAGTKYCNQKTAPYACLGSSVCQVFNSGTGVPVGKFNLKDLSTLTSIDSNVLTVQGRMDKNHSAMIHYVCKTGDLDTPPVFINVTNGEFYEFHWTTFAACPLGVTVGDGCMVTQETTGFVFNLSSLSATEYDFQGHSKGDLQDHSATYRYQIAVCAALNTTQCPTNTAVCQVGQKSSKSAGNFNTSLVYADGTLKLHYNGGTSCSHYPHRNSTILFECDSVAHTPFVDSVTEVDYCQYVVEMRTKLACPPAYRITECVHIDDDGHSYDFSELSKTTGNWQASGPDGSIYYINVCHPLNRRAGCSPLSAVCKEKTTSGRTAYSDLGLASTSNFTVVHRSSQKDRVVLRYNFTRSDAQPGECEVVETLIELVCSSTITVERGPRFVSGGDEDNHCQYTFIWETRGACPVHTAREEMSCTVTDSSSGYTFDLSPLHSNRSYFLVNSDTNGGPTWNVTLCGALNSTCSNTREDVGTVPVCQYTSDSRAYVCGSLSTQTLQYLDRSLSLRYTGGDLCHHSGRNRSVLINFECDNSVYIGEPRYVREDNCDYTFEWPTVLACLPRELECVAEGEKYDLRALLEIRNWEVNVGGDSRYHYVIGGCRSLNQGQLPHCPAKGGMGACRYSSDGSEGGRVLGYVTSDLVEERSGRLRLSYYNGDRCANGRKSAVHVYFQCAAGGGAGVPHLQEDSDDSCETTIEWLTQYACPLDATATNSWVINNTVTHQVFNLTKLSPTLSSVYVEQDGTRYNYTVSLAGHTVGACGSHNDSVGACQVKVGTSEAHLLGRVNNTLQLLGEELRVEYTNGSVCTHVHKPRKAVITFECDSREFLQVLPEADCEYSFVVHTDLACAQTSAISVECSVDGFDDLQVFLSLKSSPIVLSNTSAARAFISVCDPISRDNQENSTALRCPSGAAACIVDTDRKIHLGKPTPRLPPTVLSGGEGVILNYTQGDICNSATGQRYQTALLLVCNRNKPVGAPELISYTACEYIFRWESIHACRLTLPSTPLSKTVCNITDPVSHSTYDFRTLVQQEHFVINKTNSNTRYHLKLCGSASSPPTGCDANTGICVTDSNGGNPKTILYADHKISITSRLPYEFEIIYPSGVRCGSDSSKKWTAFVTLQCDARGGTQQPEFVSDDHCELQLQWRNSSFCLGDRACVATDPHTRFIFNLDGLYSQTWTGLVADWNTKGAQSRDKGGTFTLGFCRNLNPFSSVGRHCSSPSGICWHLPGGNQHLNLGHMTTAPKVGYNNGSSIIHLVYSGGDRCDSDPTKKYHTDIFLTCGEEHSTPLLWNHHDCSFGITMETPVACRPGKTNSTSCILSQSIGTYNFNPLAHNITFMDSTTSTPYKVCLCPNSPFCPTAGIWQGGTSLGTFQRMTATGSLGGPRVLFLHGDNCGGDHVSYQSTIFMECNRSADPSRGTFALQRTLSRGCQKYFFWSTPYACLSEQISCLLSVESDSSFYDFNPLYSRSQPWRVNGANSRDQFMINICGPIRNGTGNNKCSPESSVCVRRSSGQYDDVGTADTQQMITTAGGHVQIMFSGAGQCQGGKSHTTINMVCGIQGLRALPPPDSCHYEFEWHTPYACKEEDQPETVSLCQDKVRASDNFFFYPKRLHSSTDYTVNDTDSTYYLNLCGPAASCGSSNGDVSVCSRKPSESSIVTTIASYKQQHILADGYWMRFQMDLTPGKRHAIVLVQCLTGDSISQPAAESIEFQNHVQTKDAHHYYYFQLYTKKGCSFEPPTTAPSPTHGGGSQDTGGGSSQSSGGKAAGVIITVLVIVAVVAIVAACILYKRERRQYAMSLIIKVCGSKASEPVRYHKLPTRSRDEEIALLEEESEEEYEKGEGEGEGEGKGKGGGEKEASDGTNTDDELLNL